MGGCREKSLKKEDFVGFSSSDATIVAMLVLSTTDMRPAEFHERLTPVRNKPAFTFIINSDSLSAAEEWFSSKAETFPHPLGKRVGF